jgi:hypothetical protein
MTSPASMNARYRRSADVDETRVGERVVLYHRGSGNGVVLNPTGSLVWNALASPLTANEVVDTLARRYASVERDRLSRDVNAYIDSLRAQSLIDANE